MHGPREAAGLGYVFAELCSTEEFIEFLLEEDVFVCGRTMSFSGGTVIGPGETFIIRGDLTTDQINMGASIAATTIYVDGDLKLSGGSVGLGSSVEPGNIYVNGNVQLGWTPTLSAHTGIYYAGSLSHPHYYSSAILAKCHQIPYGDVQAFPEFSMPLYAIPPPQSIAWFAVQGYQSGSAALVTDIKIFTESDYVSASWYLSAYNVIVVSTGDIIITGLGGSGLTGVLFAPYGKVTFNGGFFEGFVTAQDGFFVTSSGTRIEFKGIENYITNPSEYSFHARRNYNPRPLQNLVKPAISSFPQRRQSSVIRNFLDSPLRANDENGCCAKVSIQY